jgi:hypothetical protein
LVINVTHAPATRPLPVLTSDEELTMEGEVLNLVKKD